MPEPGGGPGGPGGPLVPPIFGGSVNPVPTGEGRLSPSITTGPSKVPASLNVYNIVSFQHSIYEYFQISGNLAFCK